MSKISYHSLSWEEVVRMLGSDARKGLSEGKAKLRQEEFGKNALPEEKPFSKLKIFLGQLSSPLVYILLIAGVITLFLKDFSDSAVILAAVVLNTVVGFFQEKQSHGNASQTKENCKNKGRSDKRWKYKNY